MNKNKLEVVRNKFGYQEGFCVDNIGHSGGIGSWWRDSVVNLIFFSNHQILVEVKEDCFEFGSWFVCGLYG